VVAPVHEAQDVIVALPVAGRLPRGGPLTPLLYETADSVLFNQLNDTQHPQAPTPSSVLGVFGLSIRTQERDLEDEFNRFGRVEKVTIVYDQRVRYFLRALEWPLTPYPVRPLSWIRFHQDVDR